MRTRLFDAQCTTEEPLTELIEEKLSRLQATAYCELPNNMTNDFNGSVRLSSTAEA